ncbi:hypothetical protein CB1_000098001, partial [Camelus ferus]
MAWRYFPPRRRDAPLPFLLIRSPCGLNKTGGPHGAISFSSAHQQSQPVTATVAPFQYRAQTDQEPGPLRQGSWASDGYSGPPGGTEESLSCMVLFTAPQHLGNQNGQEERAFLKVDPELVVTVLGDLEQLLFSQVLVNQGTCDAGGFCPKSACLQELKVTTKEPTVFTSLGTVITEPRTTLDAVGRAGMRGEPAFCTLEEQRGCSTAAQMVLGWRGGCENCCHNDHWAPSSCDFIGAECHMQVPGSITGGHCQETVRFPAGPAPPDRSQPASQTQTPSSVAPALGCTGYPESQRKRTVQNVLDLRQNLEETMCSLRGSQVTH